MRIFSLILLVMAFSQKVNCQFQPPKMVGSFSWVPSEKHKLPDTLKVKAIKVQMDTRQVANENPFTAFKPINPGTILLKKGKVNPQINTYRYSKKQKLQPEIRDAAILLQRDNAEFNVSYSDKQHGFISNNTTDFSEDSNHHIWMASDKGLIRYDGYHYYLYNKEAGLPEMTIESLQMDATNRLWLGSDKGVYIIQDDSIYSLQGAQLDFTSLYCRKIQLDYQKRIWLSTKEHGAICVDDKNISIYNKLSGLPSNYVHTSYVDKKGNILLGIWDLGLVVIHAGEMKLLFSKNKSMLYHDIATILECDNNIWLGGFAAGLIKMNNSDTIQYSFTNDFNDRIYDIVDGPKGIYCSIYGSGIAYFNGKSHLLINRNNGLIENSSYHLFKDSFENLWIADLSNGFSRLNENSFYIQPFQNKTLRKVMGMLPDFQRGNWILSEGNGLAYDNGNAVTLYSNTLQKGIKPMLHPMSGVVNNDGSIWLSSYGAGIVYGKNTTFTFYRYDDFWENEIIFSVKKDATNTVWFSTMRFGIISYRDQQFWHYTKDHGLLNNEPILLYQDENNQTICSFQNGIQRITNKGIETLYINGKQFADHVNDWAILKNGTKVFATEHSGIFFLAKNQVWQVTISNGLISNTIKKIIEDKSENIWISSAEGIESFKWIGAKLINNQIYHTGYGLFLLNAREPFLNENGTPFWSVGDKKLVFDSITAHKTHLEPIFKITSVSVDNQLQESLEKINILPDQKLEINFTNIFWGKEQHLELGYLIISSRGDSSFRNIGKKGQVLFNDLVPDSYKIILVAKDGNTRYYSKAISMQVRNFWYNTWVFRIGMLILLLGVIYYYYKLKERNQIVVNELLKRKVTEQTKQIVQEKEAILKNNQTILAQNKEKDALVQEVNHRVKNNLQFVSAMVEMQLNSIQNKETIESLFETKRRINAMSLVHEMLYQKTNKEGLFIKGYIVELVNNLKELTSKDRNSIEFHLDIADIFLDSKMATSLGMIISELVSNSIEHGFKHTEFPKISIQLLLLESEKKKCLIVKDNGNVTEKGIKMGSGLGTRLIDIFSRQLEGEYEIEIDSGLQFKLIF